VRWAALALAAGGALVLRALDAPVWLAAGLAGLFGLIGVGVMLVLSRRFGQMVHCTAFCPIGPVANLLGRLSPFRVRFGPRCTECRACTFACRYHALTAADIRHRKPGFNCTLCGDCLSRCRHSQLSFAFAGLSPTAARAAFVVLVVALHAAFLGLARI
jgi:polyferredoxin